MTTLSSVRFRELKNARNGILLLLRINIKDRCFTSVNYIVDNIIFVNTFITNLIRYINHIISQCTQILGYFHLSIEVNLGHEKFNYTLYIIGTISLWYIRRKYKTS